MRDESRCGDKGFQRHVVVHSNCVSQIAYMYGFLQLFHFVSPLYSALLGFRRRNVCFPWALGFQRAAVHPRANSNLPRFIGRTTTVSNPPPPFSQLFARAQEKVVRET